MVSFIDSISGKTSAGACSPELCNECRGSRFVDTCSHLSIDRVSPYYLRRLSAVKEKRVHLVLLAEGEIAPNERSDISPVKPNKTPIKRTYGRSKSPVLESKPFAPVFSRSKRALTRSDVDAPKSKRMTVVLDKTQTLKDIKVIVSRSCPAAALPRAPLIKLIKFQVSTKYDVPTIYQRVFHNLKELLDNSATVESLGILPYETIDIIQVSPGDEDNLSDVAPEDLPSNSKKARSEGRGFSGTGLLGSRGSVQAPKAAVPKPIVEMEVPRREEKEEVEETDDSVESVELKGAVIADDEEMFDAYPILVDDVLESSCPSCT